MVTKSGREKTKSTHWHARTWLGFASRRTDAEITALREGIVDIVTEFEPVTCRQVFYLCVGRGLVEKTENECGSVDRLLIETLYSDAMQIRVCVLTALAQYAFRHASEGVRVNAFRAASIYTGMAARMTQLLQDHAAVMVPDFVAAM